jgi:hypothetical protein
MDLLHSHERFHLAFRGLAVSSAPLTKRIADVFAAYLADLEPSDLPPEVGARFKAYREAWRAQDVAPHLRPLGLIALWARSLSWRKAREVAHWIVDAHDEIDGLLNEELYRSR